MSTPSERTGRPRRRMRTELTAEEAQASSLDLRNHLTALLRFWLSATLVTVLGVLVALGITLLIKPTYQSSITFFVATSPSGGSSAAASALQADEFAQRRINSYIGVVTSQQFAQQIVDDTGVALSATALRQMISATAEPQTVLLDVTVNDVSAQRSLIIARSIDKNLDATIGQLEDRGSTDAVQLRAISGPELNPDPVSPRKKLNLAIGLLIGLAVGVGQALVRHQLDSSFRDRDRLTATTGLPLVGELPFDRNASRNPVLLPGVHAGQRGESFRQLRTNLRFMDAAGALAVVVVTSSVSGEGKSTTAANLAESFAEAGRRTVLVDADFRQPRLHSYLGLELDRGLTSVLIGDADLDAVAQDWGDNDLKVLTCGPTPPNPSELLGSAAMEKVIAQLRSSYEIVIVDSPPLLPVTDAAILATLSDGVLLAVQSGRTRRDQVAKSLDALNVVGARVLGTVFTMVPRSRRDRKSTYYRTATTGDANAS